MYLIKNTIPVLEENNRHDINTAIDIIFGVVTDNEKNKDQFRYKFIEDRCGAEYLIEKANVLIVQHYLEDIILPLLLEYLSNKFTCGLRNQVYITSIDWDKSRMLLFLDHNDMIEMNNDVAIFFTQHQISLNIYNIGVDGTTAMLDNYHRFCDTLLDREGPYKDKKIADAVGEYITISCGDDETWSVSIELAPTKEPKKLFEMIDLLFQL